MYRLVDRTSCSDKTGEPANHDCGAIRYLQKREEWEDHDDCKAVDGNTFAGRVGENLRSSSVQGKTVQGTDSAVGVSVSC